MSDTNNNEPPAFPDEAERERPGSISNETIVLSDGDNSHSQSRTTVADVEGHKQQQLTPVHAKKINNENDTDTPAATPGGPADQKKDSSPTKSAATSAHGDGTPSSEFRNINIGNADSHATAGYASNKIKTTKYSVIPFLLDFFLWKMLFEQFQRQANIYFAVISALQLVPGLSPTGKYTTLMTLCFVLTFSMCKSGFEDYKRYKKDKEVNSRVAYVLRRDGDEQQATEGGKVANPWVPIRYTDVRVGDIIRVLNVATKGTDERNNDIPCDIAVLTTSEADGTCYVETANLDGETNLKARRCLEQTKISPEELSRGLSFAASFSLTPQDSSLNQPSTGKRRSISGNNELQTSITSGQSGAFDKQTSMSSALPPAVNPIRVSKEVGLMCNDRYGELRMETEHPNGSLYTFTGNLFMEDGTMVTLSPDQMLYRGCVLRKVHWIIGVVVFTGAETKVFQNAKKPPHKSSRVELMVNRLLISVLALQMVMCIICTIGLRLQKHDMWYLRDDGTSADVRAGLGFLTFIILFNNLIPISLYVSLEMIKFIQGRMMEQDLCMYYSPKDMPASAKSTDLNEELGQINYIFSDKTGTLTRNVMTFMKFCINGKIYGTGTTEIGRAAAKRQGKELVDERPEEIQNSTFPFWDPRVSKNKWLSLPEVDDMRRLFEHLATCHTVVIDSGKYEAESPDEEALVKAAKEFGYKFIGRNSESITLHVGGAGAEEKFKVLENIEFNSDRKRMSTLLLTPDGEVKLYMKGADNVIFARLKDGQQFIDETKQCLAQFGDEGLRTLVLSERTLPQSEWEPWLTKYRAAKAIIGDNERRAKLMDELAAEIEVGMEMVGCTAIEDKLQEGVPSSIESLRLAGLKVWMLTGDKVETAINIAFACALLHNNMFTTQLVELTDHEVILQLLDEVANGGGDAEKSVVIDGVTLGHILASQELSDRLYEVTNLCTSVVCSRVSPKQKADVVEMVRYRALNSVTLSIGDGANDVPMIQAAHVGVGISGMEGQQAANAADYAIGQFKYLHRLIMVHGRSNYYRLTHTINYFFYKNIVLIMTQFWFCFFNNFTGQSLYEKWSLALYNVAWTSLPVVIYGIFDRDVLNTDNVHKFPKLYQPGLDSDFLNVKVFLGWVATAVYHSLICFFVVMYGWGDKLGDDGTALSLDGAGVTLFTCVIFVANVKLALHIYSFTWMHHLVVWGSIAVWFLFLAIYGVFPSTFSTLAYNILQNVGFQPAPWLFFFVSIVLTLARDFIWKYASYRLLPMSWLNIRQKVQFKDSTDPMAATRPPLEIRKREGFSRSDVVGGDELGNLFEDYETDSIVINPAQGFMMQFIDDDLEEEFISVHLGDLKRYKVGMGLCAAASLLLVLSFVVQRDTVKTIEIVMWGLFSLSACICFIVFMCVSVNNVKRNIHPIMLLLMLIGASGMTIANLSASQRDPETHPVSMGVILLGLLTVVRPPMVHALQYVVITFLCYLCWYQGFRVKEWEQLEFAVRFVELAIVAFTALISVASSENFMRRMFISQKQVKASHDRAAKEEARSLRLLANVLPSAIVKEVRMNKRQLSEFSVKYDEASMLNSDIVKFTQFSSTKEPHVVVEMLNRMFTKFDAHAASLGIEKIKTIGDAYVAAAGIPIPDQYHIHKIIAMGLRMIDSIDELNDEGLSTLRDLDIKIRVGCATGSVKSGVVGMQKVCYECFGKTAQESELMEQQGRPNRVRVSDSIKKLLEDDDSFLFENIDGGYFVKEGDRSLPTGEDDAAASPHVPLTDVAREDIYKFLEDEDTDRRDIIRLWAGFEGTQTNATLNFSEMELAELDFRDYLRHLAHTRFVSELSQGSFLFVCCAVLLGLYLNQVMNVTLIVFAVLAIVHIALWLVNYIKQTKAQTATEMDDSESNGGFSDDGDVDIELRLRRATSVMRRLSNVPDQGTSDGTFKRAEDLPFCTGIRAAMTTSNIFAFIAPILVLIFADIDGHQKGIGTIAVFIILASTIYILNTFHVRITHKYIIAAVSFVVVTIIFFYAMAIVRNFSTGTDGGDFFAIVLCYILSLISSYTTETNVRKSFSAAKNVVYQNAEVQSATALCDKLLHNVLPTSIVYRMKEAQGEQIVDEVDEASVCFLYTEGLMDAISGESPIKGDDSAVKLIEHMNKFLVLLDTLTVRHQVEKIKTSPFLVVCGCPEPNDNHAEQIVHFARDVIQSVKRFNQESGADIKIKIGIHSGKVTAGVLGSTKFLYDVFGDTVNFASRLTSSADWGQIQLSATTQNIVRNLIATKHRGSIDLKGKGIQEVFLLDESKQPQGPFSDGVNRAPPVDEDADELPIPTVESKEYDPAAKKESSGAETPPPATSEKTEEFTSNKEGTAAGQPVKQDSATNGDADGMKQDSVSFDDDLL